MQDNMLILVDGSSYFYRAFHALPPLMNSKGKPTGAIFGVASMVKKLLQDYPSSHVAVVFDAPGKTFRDEWYPEYKAHRPPTPPDLSVQFEPLIALLKAMGLPILIETGVEADDVIGTLAVQATADGQAVLVSTGDKDMAQLVNPQVHLINTMSMQTLDREGVKAKFDVWPEQIIDYLTLIGDSVDNVPGVQKCGPKTAAKWLEQYQTLENIMAHADSISGKIGEYLRESLPQLPLSKRLVTIKTDVSLPVSYQDLRMQPENKETLLALTAELEFKTWHKALSQAKQVGASENSSPKPFEYLVVTDQATWQTQLSLLAQARQFAIDTETTSLNAMEAELVGISFSLDGKLGVYVPLAHREATTQLDRETVLADIKPILENPNILKIGQNIKYDWHIFMNHGIRLQGIGFDTMLESYLLQSNVNRHDLDSLSLMHLGHQTILFEDVAGKKGAKQLRFDEISIEKAGPYAAEDAAICLQLHDKLWPKLSPELQELAKSIEFPLVSVLAEMEHRGVRIDVPALIEHGTRLKQRLQTLEQEAFQLAGKGFNLQSPKQLQTVLFDELKLPIINKTPTGQPSTAESVLQEMAYDHPLPKVILEHRSLSKLVSTYIDALPMCINPKTERVHTSYNQAVTATGRLSSSDPNLQNIPIRTEEGRLIRKAFIASPGSALISADYSQIELRIMAHLSQDPNLIYAFRHEQDIHRATAAEIFGLSIDKVGSDERRKAKAVNFGLIYGMSAFGLARQIGVDRQEAQAYINRYFERYPGVLEYMERTRKLASAQGYVSTLFGRRLYLPEIHSPNKMRKMAAERTAINAPMQGSAADIIKLAMLAVMKLEQRFKNDHLQMIMQVHDELVFEVRKEAVTDVVKHIKFAMETAASLSVPLLVDVGVGQNWDEAH